MFSFVKIVNPTLFQVKCQLKFLLCGLHNAEKYSFIEILFCKKARVPYGGYSTRGVSKQTTNSSWSNETINITAVAVGIPCFDHSRYGWSFAKLHEPFLDKKCTVTFFLPVGLVLWKYFRKENSMHIPSQRTFFFPSCPSYMLGSCCDAPSHYARRHTEWLYFMVYVTNTCGWRQQKTVTVNFPGSLLGVRHCRGSWCERTIRVPVHLPHEVLLSTCEWDMFFRDECVGKNKKLVWSSKNSSSVSGGVSVDRFLCVLRGWCVRSWGQSRLRWWCAACDSKLLGIECCCV